MQTDERDRTRLPTDDEESRFWSLLAEARSKADGSEETLLGDLAELCEDMSSAELTDLVGRLLDRHVLPVAQDQRRALARRDLRERGEDLVPVAEPDLEP